MQSVVECYRGRNVRIFRLDQESVVTGLRARARALLAARPDALEVWLFGSLARGEARPGSDADVFVVLRDGAPPFLDRLPELARLMGGSGVGCDVIAYTQAEVERGRVAGERFLRTVFAEGLLLARRAE